LRCTKHKVVENKRKWRMRICDKCVASNHWELQKRRSSKQIVLNEGKWRINKEEANELYCLIASSQREKAANKL